MLLPKRQPRFESRSQSWSTPQSLFNRLNEEFHFTIDLAADSANAKCPVYYTAEEDALQQEWKGVCWLNPPFNSDKARLRRWVQKAFESDCVVVMLVPAHTNTNWWHTYCMKAAEIRFLHGRPKFGDAKCGLVQAIAIVVFDKSRLQPSRIRSYKV
jgi:phage N-6-adenine-methyltransferase